MNRYYALNLLVEATRTMKRDPWTMARDAIASLKPEDKATAWALSNLVDTMNRLARRCEDCKKPSPEIFMVTDELWAQYGVGDKILCITCFAVKLPRPLTTEDFKHVPCNDLLFFGARNLGPGPSGSV